MKPSEGVVWKPGDPVPAELYACKNVFLSSMVPRLLAWMCTNDSTCSLLDGYSAICYSPPTLMLSSSALPSSSLHELLENKRCSLSAVTARESEEMVCSALMESGESPPAFSFAQLNLKGSKKKPDYPCVIENSPIQMYCTLYQIVELSEKESMILLTVETFVIDGSVLSPATEEMRNSRASVVARIDAGLIQPWVGVGNGRVAQLSHLADMPRPKRGEQGQWHSTELSPLTQSPVEGFTKFETVEWSFRRDGRECSLGYNPVTAIVMPRPIGWISTYRKDGRVPHVAPYSFFCDVARGETPMLAFSGYRPDAEGRKDAQRDSEEMKCFGYNLVTHNLAVPMNYSAAPLPSINSEFELAGIEHESALTIDAPLVAEAKIRVECEYVKTVDVQSTSFSIVVGQVKCVQISRQLISDGSIDTLPVRPITRLGYMNEYGVL